MCGHTEATARISYVPFKQLGRKIGLVGIPVRGASLTIDPVTAELVYPGLSRSKRDAWIAENHEDLAKGDELQRELRTGDLARKDDDSRTRTGPRWTAW